MDGSLIFDGEKGLAPKGKALTPPKGGDEDERLDKGNFRNYQDNRSRNKHIHIPEKSKKVSEKQKNGSAKPVQLTRRKTSKGVFHIFLIILYPIGYVLVKHFHSNNSQILLCSGISN